MFNFGRSNFNQDQQQDQTPFFSSNIYQTTSIFDDDEKQENAFMKFFASPQKSNSNGLKHNESFPNSQQNLFDSQFEEMKISSSKRKQRLDKIGFGKRRTKKQYPNYNLEQLDQETLMAMNNIIIPSSQEEKLHNDKQFMTNVNQKLNTQVLNENSIKLQSPCKRQNSLDTQHTQIVNTYGKKSVNFYQNDQLPIVFQESLADISFELNQKKKSNENKNNLTSFQDSTKLITKLDKQQEQNQIPLPKKIQKQQLRSIIRRNKSKKKNRALAQNKQSLKTIQQHSSQSRKSVQINKNQFLVKQKKQDNKRKSEPIINKPGFNFNFPLKKQRSSFPQDSQQTTKQQLKPKEQINIKDPQIKQQNKNKEVIAIAQPSIQKNIFENKKQKDALRGEKTSSHFSFNFKKLQEKKQNKNEVNQQPQISKIVVANENMKKISEQSVAQNQRLKQIAKKHKLNGPWHQKKENFVLGQTNYRPIIPIKKSRDSIESKSSINSQDISDKKPSNISSQININTKAGLKHQQKQQKKEINFNLSTKRQIIRKQDQKQKNIQKSNENTNLSNLNNSFQSQKQKPSNSKQIQKEQTSTKRINQRHSIFIKTFQEGCQQLNNMISHSKLQVKKIKDDFKIYAQKADQLRRKSVQVIGQIMKYD